MFKKRLIEISNKIGGSKEKYFVLTHKKHKREIYFRNTSKAINFMSPKFNSIQKRFIYILIKLGFLQPFLKEVNLSHKLGKVIYVANQIKGFDLNKKTVFSFPTYRNMKKDFVKSKKFQKKVSSKGFAPKIIEFDEKIPYAKEELLKEHHADYISIFKRLREFYSFIGIEKIPVKKYVSDLKKKVKDSNLIKKLNFLSKQNFEVLITTLHGDLARENILVKNGEIVFVDWNPYKSPITDDLANLLKKGLSKEIFKSILEFYPEEIKNKLNYYLMLSKISLRINKN